MSALLPASGSPYCSRSHLPCQSRPVCLWESDPVELGSWATPHHLAQQGPQKAWVRCCLLEASTVRLLVEVSKVKMSELRSWAIPRHLAQPISQQPCLLEVSKVKLLVELSKKV